MSIWLHSICWPHQWVLCIIKEVFPLHIWFSTCQSLLHAAVHSVSWNLNTWAMWVGDGCFSHDRDSPAQPGPVLLQLPELPLSLPHCMNLAAHLSVLCSTRGYGFGEKKQHHAVNAWALAAGEHEMRSEKWVSCLTCQTWQIWLLGCAWGCLHVCICPSCVSKNVTKIKLPNLKLMLFSSKSLYYIFTQNNNWIHVPTKLGK